MLWSSYKIKNYDPCTRKGVKEYKELFIIEGDSAKGSLKLNWSLLISNLAPTLHPITVIRLVNSLLPFGPMSSDICFLYTFAETQKYQLIRGVINGKYQLIELSSYLVNKMNDVIGIIKEWAHISIDIIVFVDNKWILFVINSI